MSRRRVSIFAGLLLFVGLTSAGHAAVLANRGFVNLFEGQPPGFQGYVQDMAYDPVTQRVFTANDFGNSVSVVNVADPDHPSLEMTLDLSQFGCTCPTGLAADIGKRRLFVGCWASNTVGTIGLDKLISKGKPNFKEIVGGSAGGARELAYDGKGGLYTVGWNGGLAKYQEQKSGGRVVWNLQANTPFNVSFEAWRILYYDDNGSDALVVLNATFGSIEVWKIGTNGFYLDRFVHTGAYLYSGKLANTPGKDLYLSVGGGKISRYSLDPPGPTGIEDFPGYPIHAVDCAPDESYDPSNPSKPVSRPLLYYPDRNIHGVGVYDLDADSATSTSLPFAGWGGSMRFIEASGGSVYASDDFGLWVLTVQYP